MVTHSVTHAQCHTQGRVLGRRNLELFIPLWNPKLYKCRGQCERLSCGTNMSGRQHTGVL